MAKLQANRDSYLDAVRGIAILGVIMVHSGGTAESLLHHSAIPPLVSSITVLGRFGVQLFFMLSGWLIESIYGLQSGTKFQAKRFFVRRIARIYPLWITFLALGFILPLVGMGTGVSSLMGVTPPAQIGWQAITIVLLTLSFTLWILPQMWNTVIPGGWSIQAEVGHYLIYPFTRAKSSVFLIVGIAVVRLTTAILYFTSTLVPGSWYFKTVDAWLRLGLHNSLIFFIAGILIARWKSGTLQIPMRSRWVILMFLGSIILNADGFGEELQKFGFIAFALCLAYAARGLSPVYRGLVLTGKYSYFIYFSHFVFLGLAGTLLDQTGAIKVFDSSNLYASFLVVGLMAFALFASLAVAPVSWKLLERPLINLSRRY